MKKTLLTAIIFLPAIIAFAQNSDLEVVNLKSDFITYYGFENIFPEVRCKSNPRIAEKINIFLQIEELEQAPNGYKEHPFEKVTYDTNRCCNGVNFVSWKKNETPHNIFSLTLTKEALTGFTVTHNFDARTGNKLMLKDIFSEVGTKEIQKILHNHIRAKIDNFLAGLKKSLDEKINEGGKENDDDENRAKAQIDLYQNCFHYKYELDLEYVECVFEDKEMTIAIEECSVRVNRAIDDLGEFSVSLSYDEIEKYMSEYGKSLLSRGKNEVTSSPNPCGKIFKGKINSRYPITAIVTKIYSDDNSPTIYYWYDKEKIPIEWHGKYKNKHLTLTEREKGNLVANIDAKWVDNKIVGTWTKAGTQKALKLELEEY
jgi:hypothetical protein